MYNLEARGKCLLSFVIVIMMYISCTVVEVSFSQSVQIKVASLLKSSLSIINDQYLMRISQETVFVARSPMSYRCVLD